MVLFTRYSRAPDLDLVLATTDDNAEASLITLNWLLLTFAFYDNVFCVVMTMYRRLNSFLFISPHGITANYN